MTAANPTRTPATSERIAPMTTATWTPKRFSHVLSAVVPLRDLPHSEPGLSAVQVAMRDVVAWAFQGRAVGDPSLRVQGGLCHVGSIGRPGAYSAVQVDVEFDGTDEDALARFESLSADPLLGNLVVGGRVARWVVDSAPGETYRAHQETFARLEPPTTLA